MKLRLQGYVGLLFLSNCAGICNGKGRILCYTHIMITTITEWLQNLCGSLRNRTKTDAAAADREPVSVYTAANAMEAELVRALLETEGIPAYASGQALSSIYGMQVGPLAEVDVMVMAEMAAQAQKIVEERHIAGGDWVEIGEDEWNEGGEAGEE